MGRCDVAGWREAHHEMGGFIAGAEVEGFELMPTVMAWATPSGPVDDPVLDEVAEAIIQGVRQSAPMGCCWRFYGAMVTATYADADGEVLRRLRTDLGPEFPIVTSLDYHANVSAVMGEHADALIGYQTYPHVDQRERGLVAAGLMARTVRGEVRPVTAVAQPALIVPLLGQATDREPMRTLMTARASRASGRGCYRSALWRDFPTPTCLRWVPR